MKTENEQFAASATPSACDVVGRPVDRRRFMESAAAVGTILGLDAGIWGQAAAVQLRGRTPVDSLLPDGTEFASWEQ
ncbi:MAG TPA: hypothetical protein VLL04_09935, partial [Rhizomicrobium sp.]|nr:hypothetical protein [Rhizomicrobium sp.]